MVLLGCVSEKLSRAAAARDLYVSPLWKKRRRYAEQSGAPWLILSAEYGLVHPDAVIESYDRSLKAASSREREAWGREAGCQIAEAARLYQVDEVEIHAGKEYAPPSLVAALQETGVRVSRPLEHLRIGEQLAWYSGSHLSTADSPEVQLEDVQELGLFEFRWWSGDIEHFERGWDIRARVDRQTFDIRHGIGRRDAYGEDRVHSVTWLNGNPMVEGVAADDYPTSRGLLSTIRRADGRHVRSLDELPPGYGDFDVVHHRSEIQAPYSRDTLVAKIREDDLQSWVRHAVLRHSGPDPSRRREPPAIVSGEEPERAAEPMSDEQRRQVVEALLHFGESQMPEVDQEPSFTPDPDANAFLFEDPFAFLIGVVCDQGIRAERAWAIPYELRRRLGYLDPFRMAVEPDRVREAFRQPPALHRYVKNVPAWVVGAARQVVERYDGDAGLIWGDEPTARDLQRRLRQFAGIGQKKAAMAVEILERDLGIPIRELSGSDIAYDVHIRRVFLRTGLAERDDLEHMVEVARSAHPERPGAVDWPAWVVGRTWCHAGIPDCPDCVLVEVCPKLVHRGGDVRGA